jgi:hypothetical protein
MTAYELIYNDLQTDFTPLLIEACINAFIDRMKQ